MLRARTDDVGYQFHWDAETYLDLMRAEVPAYERLQEATANATLRKEGPSLLLFDDSDTGARLLLSPGGKVSRVAAPVAQEQHSGLPCVDGRCPGRLVIAPLDPA